jgi:adenosylmethionine-8-amino-7-oxononanoate aminotransferase
MCRDADIIVIADEVATGLGRTGQWVAWPKEIHIGVLVLGKGLCAGYMPLAATLYDQTIFDDFFSNKSSGPLRFGSTMDGAPAALAAALATVRLLKDLDTPSVVTRTRQLIDEPLNKLLAIPIVKKVQGLGLMVGICLCDPTDNTKPIPRAYYFIRRLSALRNS